MYVGAEVSLYYDPLLSKLIVWAENRPAAVLRMRRALREYRIVGVKTSIPLHQQIVDTTQFIGGTYDTAYLTESFSMEHHEGRGLDRVAAIAATLLAHQRRAEVINQLSPAGGPSAWKLYGRREAMRR